MEFCLQSMARDLHCLVYLLTELGANRSHADHSTQNLIYRTKTVFGMYIHGIICLLRAIYLETKNIAMFSEENYVHPTRQFVQEIECR